jgi:transcriptional regulator with XRE-family HTH domain
MAFNPTRARGIVPYMEGKYSNYVKEWRQYAKLSQKQLVARLIELAGEGTPDDPELRIPTTEASLSRIENGKQNFNMATLQALAKALDVDEPGWLLDRKPGPGAEIIQIWDHLSIDDQERARGVLEAMFKTAS